MILIIDFGSQTAHLIGRRLRDLGVKYKIITPHIAAEKISATQQAGQLSGVILSGGPASVYEDGAPRIAASVILCGVPVLGICYGWQLMALELGGKVEPSRKEYGPAKLGVQRDILGIKKSAFEVFMSHGDTVTALPKGFHNLAKTTQVATAAAADEKRKLYGLQFHPEVEHTVNGIKMLRFLLRPCAGRSLHPMSSIRKRYLSMCAKQSARGALFVRFLVVWTQQ
jgi:GMP synthase (glutamine-hydrolysing)